jgi:hypothetical protein
MEIPVQYCLPGEPMTDRIVFLSLVCGLFAATVTAHAAAPSIDGVWRAGDHGQVLEVNQNTLRVYEITGGSCIEAGAAKRRSRSAAGETVFFSESLGAWHITADAEGLLWLHSRGIYDAKLQQMPALPDTCGKVADTQASNYDVFWRTFSEGYPFFSQRKIDWAGVDKQFRPQATGTTSPAELFGILRQMIEPLHDAHTSIEAKSIGQRFEGSAQNPRQPDGTLAGRSEKIVRQRYIHGELRNYCHVLGLGSKPSSGSLLHFGLLGDSIGYLRVDAILSGCEKELDQIFRAAAELKGLVIDQRLGWDGGNDPSGQAIELASRLTSRDYLAYSRVRGSTPQPEMVRASSRPGFGGRVALLIGPASGAAAELFAMASFGREPHVAGVGDRTQGTFSEVMRRRLPNGWNFALPYSSYLAQDGRTYDFIGIQPEVPVPVFPDEDLKAGRDGGLETAIQLLKQAGR